MIIVVGFVVAIVLIATVEQERLGRWRIAWGERWRLISLQDQCAAWSLPSGTAVLEPDPAKAQQLLTNGGTYRRIMVRDHRRRGPVTVAAHHDLSWQVFERLIVPAAERAREPSALVFSHRRSSPAGNRRIVVVSYFASTPSWFQATVIVPGSLIGAAPRHVPRGNRYADILVDQHGLRLLAGMADRTDPSRFTIPYELDTGERGTIRGQLRDDDTVVLDPIGGTTILHPSGTKTWFPTSDFPAGLTVPNAASRPVTSPAGKQQ